MAPNGFTQRFTGKIRTGVLWLGRQQMNGSGAAASYSTAGTQTIAQQARVNIITGSSGLSVFTLGFMPNIGHEYDFTFVVSSGVMLKAMAGSAFDASTNLVMKTTAAMNVKLIGISTVAWRVASVFPISTAGGGPVGGLTFSATT